jgi:hypothetical protein
MDGGASPELELYLERSEIVVRALLGPEFYGLIHEAEQIAQDTQLEAVEALYGRAFDLIRDACTRVQQQRAEYDHVLEWRNEATIHGAGHPTLRDALFEAYYDFWVWDPSGQATYWPFAGWSGPREAEAELERRLVLMGEELHMMIDRLPQ